MKFRKQRKYHDIDHYYLQHLRKQIVRKVVRTVGSWIDKSIKKINSKYPTADTTQ